MQYGSGNFDWSPNNSTRWQKPRSRDFAALSDCGLYAEVLQVAASESRVSAPKLMSEEEGVRQRLRRLQLIQYPSKTNIYALLSALDAFGWLKEDVGSRGTYLLTPEGANAAAESLQNPTEFRTKLAAKLHERYIIPGWFISRLYILNPNSQGEIVLPAPPKFENVERRLWTNNEWPDEFNEVAINSAKKANDFFPGSFPIPMNDWLSEIKKTWNQIGAGTPPGKTKRLTDPNRLNATFGTRERLFHAMREASVKLLFSATAPGSEIPDFTTSKHPIPPRSFQVWCPRLSELEFIFYTDYHPLVPGRILVPCSAFRKTFPSTFKPIDLIKDLKHNTLCLYQPQWKDISNIFISVLEDSYRLIANQVGSMYVSLLNVRDEVCRQLRLSAALFDSLLEQAYRDTIRHNVSHQWSISISLESDIRPEQQSAIGLNRRPVYIDNVPHSLIAIASSKPIGTI